MISYILYRTAAALAGTFPRRSSMRIAELIGLVFYVCRPSIRRNVRTNCARLGVPRAGTFPVFRNFSRAVTDLLRLARMRPEDLRGTVTVEGLEHLEAALAEGRGAILFAPHVGPWEIAGAYISRTCRPMHTVALEHPSARVTAFFSAIRKTWGFTDYPLHACAAGLTKALRSGDPVVLLVDRNFSRRGMRLRFFGEDTLLPDGHVTLALRSGAPLLPCCSYYAGADTIAVVIGEAIDAAHEGGSPAALGSACLKRIEEFIRAHPDQWFAFDHVWEKRHA